MTDNTQNNTGDRARALFHTAGLRDNGSDSTAQDSLGTDLNKSETGTGYGSSQQQYDQGKTSQYDSARSREQGTEQKQYGSDEAAKANSESSTRDQSAGRTQLGQDSAVGAGTTTDTSPLNLRSDEQTGPGTRSDSTAQDILGTDINKSGTGPGYGEQGTEQKQYGLGEGGGAGAGLGHHKAHQEGHLHRHGADANSESTRDQFAGRTQLGQDSGIGAGTTTDTSPLNVRSDELTGTGAGPTGYGTGGQTGYVGDTTGPDVLTTGSNTGTQAEHHGHHGHHHQDDSTGVKPKTTDKIIGGIEKAAGKITDNTGLYERGVHRAAGNK